MALHADDGLTRFARLSAGGDMQLTTALKGHVNTYSFYNRYKSSGDFIKISETIESRDIDLKNSGNSWSSGGAVNLLAGGNLSLVGVQINSQAPKAPSSAVERARSTRWSTAAKCPRPLP